MIFCHGQKERGALNGEGAIDRTNTLMVLVLHCPVRCFLGGVFGLIAIILAMFSERSYACGDLTAARNRGIFSRNASSIGMFKIMRYRSCFIKSHDSVSQSIYCPCLPACLFFPPISHSGIFIGLVTMFVVIVRLIKPHPGA